MEFRLVEEGGAQLVEGRPDEPFMAGEGDTTRVVEACYESMVSVVLLYAANLPRAFFDLSSGQAGEILQKLRNYRIRLAVVCPPGSVTMSSRFGEMLAEERKGPDFGVFDTREEAIEWIKAFE